MSLDFGAEIRTAITGDSSITALLSEWNDAPSVHTRRPVPTDVITPFVLISPDVSVTDEDYVNSDHPIIVRDITVYGDQKDQYRTVEQIGYLLRTLFHRQRFSISHDDYDLIELTVTGPNPAPVDDENTVARLVTLTIMARAK